MEVKTIAVIGAGTMGRGIAYASALGGFQTVLEDVSVSILDSAMALDTRHFRRRGEARKGRGCGARCCVGDASRLPTWLTKRSAMLS